MPSLECALDMGISSTLGAACESSGDPELGTFYYIPVYMQRHVPNLTEEQAIYATVILVQGVV
jgi:hypothetical protein